MGKQHCHDCQKALENNEEVMTYKTANGEFHKCRSCHEKDPVLKNFQKTEVYSRIVGYMRPVEQWNAGKTEEWKDRKVFNAGYC